MGRGAAAVTNGTLGTLDTTLLLNDTYELRLASNGDGAFGWQVGAYYTRETSTLHQETSNLDGATGAVLPTVPLLLSVDGTVTEPLRWEICNLAGVNTVKLLRFA